tara:strand:+ start:31275 stop:31853 length:579 start_codon:yes stop_codon:yes gene_type:complete
MNEAMTNAEASKYLLERLDTIEKKLDSIFYYSEGEDLLKTGAAGTWNVLEVFFHINLLNESYLDQFPKALQKAKKADTSPVKRSWIGKKLEQACLLDVNDMPIKYSKTPQATDPKAKQKAGFAVVEKVIFQELVQDLREISNYAKLLDSKNLDQIKVKTLLPIVKVSMADALFIMLEHTNRHIVQASRILKS